MLWKCIECGNVVQTQDDQPPSPIKRYEKDDHVCREWEEDKSEPHSFAPDELIEFEGEPEIVSEEESKKIDRQLRRQRIQKLKRGTFHRGIQRD